MKPIPWVLALLLISSNGWWLYRAVDQAATNKYKDQERYEFSNRTDALGKVVDECVRGKDKEHIAAQLRRLFPEDTVFEKDGAIHTAWIALKTTPEGKISGLAR